MNIFLFFGGKFIKIMRRVYNYFIIIEIKINKDYKYKYKSKRCRYIFLKCNFVC